MLLGGTGMSHVKYHLSSLSPYFTLTDARVTAPYRPNSDVCFIVVGCCVPNQEPQITKALNEGTAFLDPLHSV